MTNHRAEDFEYRRVDLLYRQTQTAPITIGSFSLVMLYAGWEQIPHVYLMLWAAIWNLSSVVRAIVGWRWRHQRTQSVTISGLKKWHSLLVAGCIWSGIGLGCMGAFSRYYLGPDQQFYIGLMILGGVSASVAFYSSSLACTMGILFPAIAIWTIASLLTGAPWVMSTMLVVFAIMFLRLANNWNREALESMRLNLELHHNKEKLRLALDSLGASSWEWNSALDVFSFDENIPKILGSSPLLFKYLKDYLAIVHPDDREVVEKAFVELPTQRALDVEHRIVTTSGDERFVVLCGKTQSKPLGTVATGIIWDITDRKTEEHVRFERDLFEKANHAKTMFLANVSHEIRTPLTSINGFTENILHDPSLPVPLKERLNVVLRSGRYLSSVVHDLLDLSKAENDSVYIQKTKINLAEEIGDSIYAVRLPVESKHLALNVIYDSEVPETIITDPTRLRQILVNLLSNSVKYTEQGHIDIRVSFISHGDSGRLHIVVVDTGMGMSDGDRNKIFQPFIRGDAARARHRQGAGLGLVLSRTLAKRMGGDLRLISTATKTATRESHTSFELTVDTGSTEGVRFLKVHPWNALLNSEPTRAAVRMFRNRRFLIVDDDEDIRWLLKDFLESKGAKSDFCERGDFAIKRAFGAPYDAVLMDIKMPIMNGYEATSLLRKKGFRNPIIALTAHANSSDMVLCYEAGCDFYLSKPIDFANLEETLQRCCEKKLAH